MTESTVGSVSSPPVAELDGSQLIAAERERQIASEGWTPKHDDTHRNEELALAAVAYALPPGQRDTHTIEAPFSDSGEDEVIPVFWPWYGRYWRPTPDDRIRELVKAGALIAAEIDRLRRSRPNSEAGNAE